MSDLDFDLRPPPDEPEGDGARATPVPRDDVGWMRRTGPRALALVLLVVVAAGAGYFFLRPGSPALSPTEPPLEQAEAPAPGLGAPATESIELPPLAETDALVRELVAQLSSHPTVAAWLATDNLIRTFTVAVANVAAGQSPAGHLSVLRPRGAFPVREEGEDLVVDARGYVRYASLTQAVASVDPAGAARLYTLLKPRIEDAYRELGVTDPPFDVTVRRAIVLLLETPLPDGPARLVPAGALYEYADLELETLEPAQKQLLRFGPEQARTIQQSLRAIALALGIPPTSLP